MRRTILILAVSAVPAAGWCGPNPPRQARAPVAKPRPAAPVVAQSPLDISKWPAFQGAILVNQVMMSGDQLKSLGGDVPQEARSHIDKLVGLAVLGYRLPGKTDPRAVIAFYDPKAIAAGYKVWVKDLSDPKEASAVYLAAGGGLLVLNVEPDDDVKGAVKLEIVALRGDVKGMSALKGLKHMDKPAVPPAEPDKPTRPEDE